MAKADVSKLKDAGFTAEMFGAPADFDAYLQPLLDDAGLRVKEAVGATRYTDATDGYLFARIVAAEVELATADLWRRYRQFLVAQSNKARSDEDGPRLQRQAAANAQAAEELAFRILAEIGGDSLATRPGVAVGTVQTGDFTETEVAV